MKSVPIDTTFSIPNDPVPYAVFLTENGLPGGIVRLSRSEASTNLTSPHSLKALKNVVSMGLPFATNVKRVVSMSKDIHSYSSKSCGACNVQTSSSVAAYREMFALILTCFNRSDDSLSGVNVKILSVIGTLPVNV